MVSDDDDRPSGRPEPGDAASGADPGPEDSPDTAPHDRGEPGSRRPAVDDEIEPEGETTDQWNVFAAGEAEATPSGRRPPKRRPRSDDRDADAAGTVADDAAPAAAAADSADANPFLETEADAERRRARRRAARESRATAARRAEPTPGRWKAFGAIAAAIVLVAALDWLIPAGSGAGRAIPVVQQTWFCPDVVGADGFDGEISLANAGTSPVSGTIDFVAPDDGTSTASLPVTVPANGRLAVKGSQLAKTNGAAIVTLAGGKVAVGTTVVRKAAGPGQKAGAAISACADRTSSSWYFAGQTTTKGNNTYLVLFNPTRDVAVVNTSFRTPEGLQEPEATQAIAVQPRGRAILNVSDAIIRQDLISATVRTEADSGRVVAAMSSAIGDFGRGLGETLGVAEPSTSWIVANGSVKEPQTEVVTAYNPSNDLASVQMEVFPDAGAQPIALQEFELQPGEQQAVSLAGVADQGPSVSLRLSTRGSGSLVVGQARGATKGGYALVDGYPEAPTKVWALPWSGANPDGTVALINPGDAEVSVQLDLLTAKGAASPLPLGGAVTVPGRAQLLVDVAALKPPPGAAGIVAVADAPIVASRTFTLDGDLAADMGIPLR